ncbi:putative metallo-beta-lactamase superfamily protein [Lyophyllum shimeji]|uniref:Metallo-beta-lactamase superfamily protein n=1 Tax=Lyophyllum shimeji TaxID=47721 RepID=A0A9P3PJ10_LYOSH|nr:putative metallo-beta-lactamase superfamily protein [Lyophyllum shimeji]
MRALPGESCREHFRAFLGSPLVFSFFDKQTSTWTYLAVDPATREFVVIDPVLDYDNTTGTASTQTADCILDFIKRKGLKISRILETHAHADHLTASQYLKAKLPGNVPVCIGKRITQVQKMFAPRYGLDPASLADAFDIYLEDDEEFKIGELSCRVIHIPGHTVDHIGYVIGKSAFTGDSIFMPDIGSARADFPGGNAKDLYSSLHRLLASPQDYRLFPCHDYPPEGRDPNCIATVDEQRQSNVHVKTGISESCFIKVREARDATLTAPKLLHPSLRVNICAGRLPSEDGSRRTSE